MTFASLTPIQFRWKYFFGSIFVVISAIGLMIWSDRRPGSSGPNSTAEAAYLRKEWNTAAKLANDRLRIEKNDVEALRILARSMARQGKDDLATAIYENRIKLDGMLAEDRFLLGQMIARQGNGDLALGVWKKALDTNPEHAEMLESLASLSAQKLRVEEAAAAAESLAKMPGQEAKGHLLGGIFQSMMENYPGSVTSLRKAFEISPEVRTEFMSPDRVSKLFARNLLRTGSALEVAGILKREGSGISDGDDESAWLMARAELQLGKASPESALQKKAFDFRQNHPLEIEPAPFAGEAQCTKCHEEIVRNHSGSRHANSFRHGPSLTQLPLPEKPLKDPDDPEVTHHFEKNQDRVEIVTRKGDQELLRVLADYAFGTAERYVTMVGRDGDGQYRAARLSHYSGPDGSGWDRTSGDADQADKAKDVLGQTVHVRDGVVRCLACHVTSPRDFRKDATERSAAFGDRGLGCESCHGPGSNHLIAAKAEMPDLAIRSLLGIDGHGMNKVCVDCHTVGDPNEIRASPEDPKWVRSAGVTFPLSRCFTQSQGKLSCITCHDPHSSEKIATVTFESKCIQCHSRPMVEVKRDNSTEFRAETVCRTGATKDCLNCHMPRIPVPVLHESLTDHYIRVRK